MSARVEDRSVLFLLSSLTMGGSERKTVRLANALTERSYRSSIAYLNGPRTLLPDILPTVPATCLHRRGKLSITALRELLRVIRTDEVRTVVAVNLYAALYAVLAKWLLPRGRLRVHVSVNTTEFVTRKEALQMVLYRWILRGADGLIFGAEAQRTLWCERYSLGDPDAHTVLYNGVDTDYFDAARVAAADAISRTSVVLISVGKFRKEKGHLDVIRAVSTLRERGIDVGLILVGDGPERARIEAEVARLGLSEHVHMAGELGDVRPFIAAAHLFVLPSIAVETFSNAALEAMSMGLPIVASEVGGIREMLAFGGGVTYPPGNVPALCALLAELASDANARVELGQEARCAALERFGWRRMVDTFCERVLSGACVGAGTDIAERRTGCGERRLAPAHRGGLDHS